MPHPDGSVDAWRDLEQLDLEFVLADLSVIEKRIEKLSTSGRHGTPAERESNERELVVLEKLAPALREGNPIRDIELGDDEQKRIRGFRFLTEKPVLVLLNIGEADIAKCGRNRRRLRCPLRASPVAGRGAVGQDRDGDRPARRRGGGDLPNRPRADRIVARARDPTVTTSCSG